jgi:hypothetical protein
MTDGRRWVDLGNDHHLSYFGWAPDRDLNPQYEGVPDVERYGASIKHGDCEAAVIFDGDVQRRLEPNRGRWTVESWEPLTISPSVLCRRCGDHGFIRQGKWVPA